VTAPRVNRRALELAIDGKPLLTTGEASEMTGYAPDHIALLLRRGLLHGERRGRDWFVDSKSLFDYVNAKPKPGPKSR
jgi:hypothetical protein